MTSACYGSSVVMIVLSAWWVLSAAPASFLEWYGTNLFDAIDGDADVNGHVAFFARSAMTAAAWAGGSEWIGGGDRGGPSDLLFYAGISRRPALLPLTEPPNAVAVAAGLYCAALAASQGGAVAVYAQAALAMDALAASRERAKGSSGLTEEGRGSSKRRVFCSGRPRPRAALRRERVLGGVRAGAAAGVRGRRARGYMRGDRRGGLGVFPRRARAAVSLARRGAGVRAVGWSRRARTSGRARR